ncbi:hypothetical protein BJY01DRAFT_242388 [Aspergillus pseudoustus]|uniref:Clavaminate synthase-like protein n=1 Tax=Aspergillus pseudoustus TaxID=1810923 RepID=A0ABR4KYG4_9EURO
MSSTVTEQRTFAALAPSLQANAQVEHGDWRDDFFKQGFYVFKNAVSREKATDYYYAKALSWLQSFDNGFDLNNRETWVKEKLPQSFKNMYLGYCAAHEKFMWDARVEPGIVEPFEQLWGTNELLVSFDTFNVTLPKRKDDDFRPWPHVDQAPERHGLACVQGLLNLAPAGPEDGGLLLMVGSSALFEEYFTSFKARGRTDVDAKHYDFYMFEPEDIAWFESKGCHQIKVNAEPGDLVLWDSRTIHHVAPIKSDVIRSVLYICMTPANLAKPEDIQYKAELFKRFEATTHWPHCNIWGHGKARVNGEIDPLERNEPLEKPVITDQILRMAGVKFYADK